MNNFVLIPDNDPAGIAVSAPVAVSGNQVVGEVSGLGLLASPIVGGEVSGLGLLASPIVGGDVSGLGLLASPVVGGDGSIWDILSDVLRVGKVF